jgi:hypothetical protein
MPGRICAALSDVITVRGQIIRAPAPRSTIAASTA